MIKINGTVVEKKSFPDGTLLVKAPEITKGWTDVTFCWLYENDSELFMLQSLADNISLTQEWTELKMKKMSSL